MKKFILTSILLTLATLGFAQRFTDQLDRGLVAMKQSTGVFLTWRILGEEYYDVTYMVYRDGEPITSTPLKVSNYTDRSGSASSTYSVAAVVKGQAQKPCKAVPVWTNAYKEIQLKHKGIASTLIPNDACCADVDGDGELEILMKFDNDSEISQSFPKNGPTVDGVVTHEYSIFEVLKQNGERLWWVNCGPNMGDFQNNEQNIVAYDWDGNGEAEVIMRAADGTEIHQSNGEVYTVGNKSINVRAATGGGTNWFVTCDYEWLVYLNGKTGEVYQCIPYPLKRLESDENDLERAWGDGYGHRASKFFFGAPYLDGRKPSIFLARGIYTRHKMIAYDVVPATHTLKERWTWYNNSNGPWKGQGYHNFAIADVDMDGRDEIVFGSMVIDDNGEGLSTTGFGHGDAEQVGDFNPYVHGLEIFACLEDLPGGTNYRDATTSKIYYRYKAGSDVGRCMAGNFTNNFPGAMGTPTDIGPISLVTSNTVNGITEEGVNQNFRIYWDGDLLEETFNGTGVVRNGLYYPAEGCVAKYGSWTPIYTFPGSITNNYTKATPCFQGDILGDWREEVIMRTADNNIRIYTTTTPTKWRNYTLWHDHQYRNAIVWQMCGYNQPPRPSYFLGELEDITIAPPPLTMTGREEVANHKTNDASHNDKHVIVCETNDTEVSIQEGTAPSVLTFNVPTWVEGTAPSECTTQNTRIIRTTYTCNVTGGGITGEACLVKQGDGILNLPNADFTHTGNTDIWAGTVNFDGTMRQSDLWLNRFAELNSNGGEFKSIKADYASVIRPGGENTMGTITTTDYTMGFGSRLMLDLYSEGKKADQVIVNKLTIDSKLAETVWSNYGPQYLQPVLEVVEHRKEGASTLEPGDYIIGQVENVVGRLENIKIEGVTDYLTFLSVNDQKQLVLTIKAVREASEIVWTGAQSSTWNFGKTLNFYVANDETQASDIFVKGDIVNFTDDGSKTSITIEGELEPQTFKVNASKNYTFSGSGSITSGALVKEGSGKLTISTENSYKGGNALKGGTTIVSTLSNETKETGNLGGVTNSASQFTIENGATIQTTATVTNGSPIRFLGDKGGVIHADANKDFIQNQPFSGTLLTKTGSGWIKTYASGASLDRAIIMDGAIDNHNGNAAKVVEFQGGALNDGVGTSNELYIPSGQKGTWKTVNRAGYTNKITGEGTLDIYCAAEQGNGWVATRTNLSLNLSAFKGTIVPHAIIVADKRFSLDTSSGSADCTFDIPENVIVQNSGKTFRIGQLTGKGTLGGFCAFRNNVSTQTNTWQVGNDQNCDFEGVFTSGDRFTKLGTGEMGVTGAWNNTGAVTISEGCIRLGEGGALGAGSLTVEKNATLAGISNATVTLANSSTTINGTVQPGETAASTSGSINFGGKNVSVSETGKIVIGLRKSADGSEINNTHLKNIGTLKLAAGTTIGAYISRRNMNMLTTDEATPDIFYVWTDVQNVNIAGNLNFDLPELNENNYWDTSRINEGILYVRYKDPTGINAIAASESVSVEVVNANGITVETFICPMNDVSATFAKLSLPKGIYLLNLQSETGKKGSMKLLK